MSYKFSFEISPSSASDITALIALTITNSSGSVKPYKCILFIKIYYWVFINKNSWSDLLQQGQKCRRPVPANERGNADNAVKKGPSQMLVLFLVQECDHVREQNFMS